VGAQPCAVNVAVLADIIYAVLFQSCTLQERVVLRVFYLTLAVTPCVPSDVIT
jgi:hypothetical protein